jgi:hypothetical protein
MATSSEIWRQGLPALNLLDLAASTTPKTKTP